MDEKELRRKIKKLRTQQGESQQELADIIGVSRETVKNWEAGVRQIKAADIYKLATHYGVSADYLLGVRNSNIQLKKEKAAETINALRDTISGDIDTLREIILDEIEDIGTQFQK